MDAASQQTLRDLRIWEIEEQIADSQALTRYPCPCRSCMGGKVLLRRSIRVHLRKFGRDPTFTNSILVSIHLSCTYASFVLLGLLPLQDLFPVLHVTQPSHSYSMSLNLVTDTGCHSTQSHVLNVTQLSHRYSSTQLKSACRI